MSKLDTRRGDSTSPTSTSSSFIPYYIYFFVYTRRTCDLSKVDSMALYKDSSITLCFSHVDIFSIFPQNKGNPNIFTNIISEQLRKGFLHGELVMLTYFQYFLLTRVTLIFSLVNKSGKDFSRRII